MLRTTIGVLSDSDALAPSFDPEETHTEFAYWISGAFGNRCHPAYRETMTGLERLTMQSCPDVPFHGEEPYGKEFRYVNANRSKIPLGKTRRATSTVLPTERNGA
jgi:hypothetical protein